MLMCPLQRHPQQKTASGNCLGALFEQVPHQSLPVSLTNCPKVKLKHGSRAVISGVISETGVLRRGVTVRVNSLQVRSQDWKIITGRWTLIGDKEETAGGTGCMRMTMNQ